MRSSGYITVAPVPLIQLAARRFRTPPPATRRKSTRIRANCLRCGRTDSDERKLHITPYSRLNASIGSISGARQDCERRLAPGASLAIGDLIQGRPEGLGSPTCITGHLYAGARKCRPAAVGRIGVEPTLDRMRRCLKRLTTRRDLNGFEIDALDCSRPDQRFDLADDLCLERRFEPPFSVSILEAASLASSSASAQRSHASQNASTCLRNFWPVSIWRRARAA